MSTTTTDALAELQAAADLARQARAAARRAVVHLSGARAARTTQLCNRLADAQCLADRLAFIVEAEVRYEQQSKATR